MVAFDFQDTPILPFLFPKVEYFPPVRDIEPHDEDIPPEDTANEIDPMRSQGETSAGIDPGNSSSGMQRQTTAGQNITGPRITSGTRDTSINDESLGGGKGKVQSDGSIVDSTGTTHQLGDRGTNPISASSSKPARTPPDTDASSQHSPGKIEEAKSSIIDRIMKGAMLVPFLIPLGILLHSLIQGEIDCHQLDGKKFQITDALSAATPQYPDGTPDFIKAIAINKNKVNISYSPCARILATDTVTIKDSNVFDGTYTPTGTPGSCKVQIDIGKAFTNNTWSNTATFVLQTSCEDRMAYQVGDDTANLVNFAGTTAGDIMNGVFGSINWSIVFLVIFAVVAFYLFFQLIAVFKGH